MPASSPSRILQGCAPRWLIRLDALLAILLMAFIATWAFTMPAPMGPAVAAAVALCFPAAVVLGVVNGMALAHGNGSAP